VIEDDAQNGADHVDARRSVALVAGAAVRRQALVSTRYTTVNVLRTIESLLGLKPLGLNDALAAPMADLFDPAQTTWDFTARASDALAGTQLPIEKERLLAPPSSHAARALKTSRYWAEAMKGQDFHVEDHLDTDAFNAALWAGLGCGPQPQARSLKDMRADRSALLQRVNATREGACTPQ